MKFLCLIAAETLLEDMSPADAAKHYAAYQELLVELRASGKLVTCSRLVPPKAAVTLRVRDGRTLVTDGPYVETKEQLGGFLLLEAKDMREALDVAARIPGAKIGCVEVRPTADDIQTLAAR